MNAKEAKLPIDLLRQLIRLDPDSGCLFWLERRPDLFDPLPKRSAEWRANNWNSKHAGAPALSSKDASGHLCGRIFGSLFYAHRVVFALHHDCWPEHTIDHINGVPDDNRPCNLRDVTHQENQKNQKTPKSNTSGVIGVSFNTLRQRWVAHATHQKKFVCIGYFKTKDEAVKARAAASGRLGFHQNHGRAL